MTNHGGTLPKMLRGHLSDEHLNKLKEYVSAALEKCDWATEPGGSVWTASGVEMPAWR